MATQVNVTINTNNGGKGKAAVTQNQKKASPKPKKPDFEVLETTIDKDKLGIFVNQIKVEKTAGDIVKNLTMPKVVCVVSRKQFKEGVDHAIKGYKHYLYCRKGAVYVYLYIFP
mmetsp:Transcript_34492/g.97296  ORF Transcript_34492/g.97296 Transcript_34492/m.97296 type:complete len:114 (-) Transcript_34492:162-503(-)